MKSLLVNNLKATDGQEDVRAVFDKFGPADVKMGRTKKTHDRCAFVTFKTSDDAKNALRGVDGHTTENAGKDGVGGWLVSYDPDSVKPPYELTNRKKQLLPKHLYSPEQLVYYLKNGMRVPPKEGGNASTGVEATKAPSPSNVTIASSQGVTTLIGQPPPDVLPIPPSKGNVSSIPDSDSKSEVLKQGF